mmetsp:Transcript_1691/g.1847  ORF Transcript_1691/g.1847 Transcript_1691/m.1847 type:complete len:262 (+) Transcript_1691:93-878(+)
MSTIFDIKNQTASTLESRIGISKPHDNDVLLGRGGSINIHPGNETFRKVVEGKKRAYLNATKKSEKRVIADSVLTIIRALEPPGRFLVRDSSTGLWHDVGYAKARDKTSQALREKAPSIRKEIEIENNALRAELQQVRCTAEQYYAPPHGQQQIYNEHNGPVYDSNSGNANPLSEYFSAHNGSRYKLFEGMENESFSVRMESNGSIGGQSLVHVFDGDSVGVRSDLKFPSKCEVKNREISEMSIELMHMQLSHTDTMLREG